MSSHFILNPGHLTLGCLQQIMQENAYCVLADSALPDIAA